MHVPSLELGNCRASATFAKSEVHVKAKSSLSSSSPAATTAASAFFFPFFCLGPCPSFPPPLAQQSAFLWPVLPQLWQVTSESAFRALSFPFPRSALPLSLLFPFP